MDPLSFNQKFQLKHHGTSDNEILISLTSPDIDSESLQSALQALVDRHALLRTSYHRIEDNSEEYYAVEHKIGSEGAILNLALVEHEGGGNADDVWAAAYKEFSVNISPLMRATLHRNIKYKGDVCNLFMVAFDPLIWDKWCFTNFLDDLKSMIFWSK